MNSLKNKLLITFGSLILFTALAIIYVASISISKNKVSYAYQVTYIVLEDTKKELSNRISDFRNFAISATYNIVSKLNIPTHMAKTENTIFSYIQKVSIFDVAENKFLQINSNTASEEQNDCIKKDFLIQKDNNIAFDRIRNSICIRLPFSMNDKLFVAVMKVNEHFFTTLSKKELPIIIIAPKKFYYDTEKRFSSLNSSEFFEDIMKNKEPDGFLKLHDSFLFYSKSLSTNLILATKIPFNVVESSSKQFLNSSIGVMFIILAISIVVFFYFYLSFTVPIKKLVEASKAIAKGEYSTKISESKYEELQELIFAFNKMQDEIKKRQNELEELNKNLENQVEQKSKELGHSAKMAAIGTLAGGIAHEFNNILGAIIGHVSLAIENNKEKEMKEALTISLQASERACNIVSRLLDFSKKRETKDLLFPINEAITNTTELIKKDFMLHNITIDNQISKTNNTQIEGDRDQIEQVILNLLINSKHAMPDGGKITITTGLISKKLFIRVKDTGRGIPVEIQDRIFEPFFTTKGVYGMGKTFGACDTDGTGLGLSVSTGIIEQHNGCLQLIESSNKGTVFEILLPLAKN